MLNVNRLYCPSWCSFCDTLVLGLLGRMDLENRLFQVIHSPGRRSPPCRETCAPRIRNWPPMPIRIYPDDSTKRRKMTDIRASAIEHLGKMATALERVSSRWTCHQSVEHPSLHTWRQTPGDTVIHRQGVSFISFMAKHPRIHHQEHRIAQFFCGNCVGAFAFFDEHENLQIARRTSACERTCGRAVDHGAQTQGHCGDMDRALEQMLSHAGSPGILVN